MLSQLELKLTTTIRVCPQYIYQLPPARARGILAGQIPQESRRDTGFTGFPSPKRTRTFNNNIGQFYNRHLSMENHQFAPQKPYLPLDNNPMNMNILFVSLDFNPIIIKMSVKCSVSKTVVIKMDPMLTSKRVFRKSRGISLCAPAQ